MQIGNSMIENDPFGGMNSTTILNKGKNSSKKSSKPRKSGNYSSGGTRAGTTGSGPAGQKRKTSANSSSFIGGHQRQVTLQPGFDHVNLLPPSNSQNFSNVRNSTKIPIKSSLSIG
jgi:hypothetical protein